MSRTLAPLSLILCLLTCACVPDPIKEPATTEDSGAAALDLDGDGATAAEDCDDADASRNPDALEICDDGADSDCDGADNDAACDPDPPTGADADGDGYTDAEDCDDGDATIFPGAPELCDWVDNDCDGETDELGALDGQTIYADADADGYGDAGEATTLCADTDAPMPAGWTDVDGDCDDADAAIWPGAAEICDGLDNDCDALVDEDTGESVYIDADGDGHGDPDGAALLCHEGEVPDGYSSTGDDCDDADADYVCTSYYLDTDGDKAGGPDTELCDCTPPSEDYTTDGNDCDETAATVHPGATEQCDEIDSDCDGSTDDPESTDATTWYEDQDEDGYGDPASSQKSCDAPWGYVDDNTDCDDDDADVHPSATETCNGIDDDCDGEDSGSEATDWYLDVDGDGYGDPDSASVTACADDAGAGPEGYAASADDCDDGDNLIHPDVSDSDCDEVDDDCDGTADDETLDTYYFDADQDGYGDRNYSLTQSNCDTLDVRYVGAPTSEDYDCDDWSASVNPGEIETCSDKVDNDCDGNIDESTCE